MSPKKLTEEDKKVILERYRQTPETTSTLADRFGVSSSTISRFLKNSLLEAEYDDLIQQKRLARVPKGESQLSLGLLEESESASPAAIAEEPVAIAEESSQETSKPPLIIRSRRRRSSVTDEEGSEPVVVSNTESEPVSFQTFSTEILAKVEETASYAKPILKSSIPVAAVKNTDLGAIVKDLDEDLDDLEDLDDMDESLEEEEEEDWEEADGSFMPSLTSLDDIRVLPLASAVFPPSCYLVIDRMAELIVRPLKEFAHLGKIPPEEVQQKTLPVFDNHRVARRFSNRTQRVIKVPDSRILHKTSSHLQAKGITRIFLDGKVYALGGK
jgi:transposase-like protein